MLTLIAWACIVSVLYVAFFCWFWWFCLHINDTNSDRNFVEQPRSTSIPRYTVSYNNHLERVKIEHVQGNSSDEEQTGLPSSDVSHGLEEDNIELEVVRGNTLSENQGNSTTPSFSIGSTIITTA